LIEQIILVINFVCIIAIVFKPIVKG